MHMSAEPQIQFRLKSDQNGIEISFFGTRFSIGFGLKSDQNGIEMSSEINSG